MRVARAAPFFDLNYYKRIDLVEYVCNTSFINFDGVRMKTYQVTVRTASTAHVFSAIAACSADAFEAAATEFADVACGITVMSEVL